MTDDSPYRCRIVDDLSRELMLYSGRDVPEADGSEPSKSVAGVMMTMNECLMAIMGFGQENRGTLSIADPLFMTSHSESVRLAGLREMLNTVCLEAARLQCRLVRSVQPHVHEGQPDWLAAGLRNESFLIQATVSEWMVRIRDRRSHDTLETAALKPDVPTSLPQMTCRRLSAKSLTTDHKLRFQVTDLIQTILQNSIDLPNLPAPHPDELLCEWVAEEAAIILSEQHGIMTGLCVYAEEQPENDTTAVSFRIQYIGVQPEFRSRGIAVRLMQSMSQHIRQMTEDQPDQEVWLKAFADQQNKPAAALYQRCRFQSVGLFDIWCRSISSP